MLLFVYFFIVLTLRLLQTALKEISLVYEIIIIFIAGFIGGYIAVKFKQPVILGYLVAGALLGIPFFRERFPLNNSAEIAEAGAGLLLFAVGVEFSIDKLEKVKKVVFMGAILQIILTVLISYFLFQLFKFSSFEAFFIGSTISLSSTAIVIKLLEDRHELETKSGNIMLGWLIIQDMAVVLIVIMLQNVAQGSSASIGGIIGAVVKSAILIALTLILGKTVVPVVFKSVAKLKSREVLLITAFILPLILALIADKLGLSFTLGAFLAGIMISESFVNHEIFSEIRPVRDIFTLIFFITIGSLFSLSYFFGHIFQIVFLTLFIITLKVLIILFITIFINKIHPKLAFKIAFGIAQIGEFAFLISKIMNDKKYISNDLNSLLISVTIISFILSPFLLAKSQYFYDKVKDFLQKVNPKLHRIMFLNNKTSDVDQPELSHHIVICGYGHVGSYVGEALLKLKIPFIAIDIDSEKVETLREQGVKIIYGDATNKEILDSADAERANTVVVALPKSEDVHLIGRIVKEMNPKAKVLARSNEEKPREGLTSSVDTMVDPEFEAALSIVHSIMVLRGEKNKKILYWLRTVKELNALHEDFRPV